MTVTTTTTTTIITVGVLALQGGFHEHLSLLAKAATALSIPSLSLSFIQVRTPADLARCSALVIPGGESTTIANVARQSGLMQPLREFVQTHKKPVWGTCAGLILLSDAATGMKHGGQELIGGLRVRVQRNHFGRQIASFTTALQLPFLCDAGDTPGPATAATAAAFQAVFIRAPVVEAVLPADQTSSARGGAEPVQVLARLPVENAGGKIGQRNGQNCGAGDAGAQSLLEAERGEEEREREGEEERESEKGQIVAVKQGNIVGMSFHPELTNDERIHTWWLREVVKSVQ